MKVTKKELNLIIENYLLQERYKNRGNYEVKIARCNFNFDDEFLQIIEIVKSGGKIPAYGGGNDDSKPDWMNPVFISAFTDAALPFMNMLVAPQFGIETFCNAMQELNRLFNNLYRDYRKGLQRAEPIDDRENKENDQKFDREYTKYVREINRSLRDNGISLTRPRAAGSYMSASSGYGSLSKNEIRLAQFLLGNLEDAAVSNQRYVNSVIEAFNYDRINNFNSLYRAAEKGKDIPGWDETIIKNMLTSAIQLWRSDPEGEGVESVKKIYLKIFEKLKAENIVSI